MRLGQGPDKGPLGAGGPNRGAGGVGQPQLPKLNIFSLRNVVPPSLPLDPDKFEDRLGEVKPPPRGKLSRKNEKFCVKSGGATFLFELI